jgi:predicted nucleic acid-binding protein
MIVVIQDANILIDLEKSDLLGHYFALDSLENHTTDFVLREVPPIILDFVDTERLRIRHFSAQELGMLVAFKANQPAGLSLTDCSVFQLAIERQAVLLTGDGKLRQCAQKAGVEVHGILWLLDQIAASGTMRSAEIAARLQTLMRINPRLPKEECQVRITAWRNAAA